MPVDERPFRQHNEMRVPVNWSQLQRRSPHGNHIVDRSSIWRHEQLSLFMKAVFEKNGNASAGRILKC
ncbi:hypothetical protein Y032_0060g3113 [Ancylostoma ceylanicum]|uniref:Uncharacterized protein n=1 Tax=Ancylostoma ceylanicum TaxID=53326 RepID=A0A016U479_9BILA|nr:hypothetical protein Y032_0060g3113 [Ancylostoma ceylanicum]